MKIVYITGCLGFIGSYVTTLCLERGWYVYGIDKCTYASNLKKLDYFNQFDNFKFENKDITEIDRLVDCDYIINTAAETHVDNSIRKSEVFFQSNILGVYHLVELLRSYCKESQVFPTLIHFSTDEVYGDIESGEHIETDVLKPSNPYSATKAAADQLIIAWGRTYKLPYNIIRPTNNYGIGQYVEKLIPKSCKYLGLNRQIPLHNNGLPIRNWLHAKDTAKAVLSVINSGVENEIFNVAGGFEQSNIDTVKKIIDCYFEEPIDNYEKYLNFEISRAGQDVRYGINDDKIRALGWKPEAIFDQEIQHIVNYYKKVFVW